MDAKISKVNVNEGPSNAETPVEDSSLSADTKSSLDEIAESSSRTSRGGKDELERYTDSFYPIDLGVEYLILKEDNKNRNVTYTTRACLAAFLYEPEVDFEIDNEASAWEELLKKSDNVLAWERKYPNKVKHFIAIGRTWMLQVLESLINLGYWLVQAIRHRLLDLSFCHFLMKLAVHYLDVQKNIHRDKEPGGGEDHGSEESRGGYADSEHSNENEIDSNEVESDVSTEGQGFVSVRAQGTISTVLLDSSLDPNIVGTCVVKVYNPELADLDLNEQDAM